MNDIKIWDNYNKQWLEPMVIFFGKDNIIWKITACKPGDDPLSDGWYDIMGNKLNEIAIVGSIEFNKHLIEINES